MHEPKQKYIDIALLLKESPGEWVLLGIYPNRNFLKSQHEGAIVALRRELGFTVTMRRNPSGDYTAWGKFDPADVQSEEEIERLRQLRSERRRNNRKGTE